MITHNQFIQLIQGYIDYLNKVDNLSDVTNLCLWETPCIEYTGKLFDFTISSLFDEQGIDDINWWLYERNPEDSAPQMWKTVDDRRVEIPTKTLDDLWNIVKNNRK